MAQRPSLIAPHDDWRLDFTLVDELPEDSVIGRNFIGHAIAGLFAAAALLALAWTSYDLWAASQGIKDWDARIGGASGDLKEVERLQRDYVLATDQLDEIHEMMNNPIALTVLLAEIGRTLPKIVSLDMIESYDGEIVFRGTLEASSEQASRLIGNYVKSLEDNPVIGPYFDDIKLSGLERFDDEEGLSFEFTMAPKTEDEDA